jgi:NADH dehydrogenase
MAEGKLHLVTGAFNYSGKYITTRLLEDEQEVRTLTNSLQRINPFGGVVKATRFPFDDQEKLVESIRGVVVLYNTYWVRFNHREFNHEKAMENSIKMFTAARTAGVERIVHTSITNPALDSPLEYFSGKARIEKALMESGVSYAILRPALLFGKEDVLINNIAWTLRRLPVFGVFEDGSYRIQPIHVQDFA